MNSDSNIEQKVIILYKLASNRMLHGNTTVLIDVQREIYKLS